MVERRDSTVACTYELFRSAAFKNVHHSVNDFFEVENSV
jgi:hypothetical protein